MKTEKEHYLDILNENAHNIKFIPNEFKDNRDFILEAINLDSVCNAYNFLTFLSDELKDDKEIVLKIVEKDPFSMLYSSNRLQADKEVLSKAIFAAPIMIQYASEDLQLDKELVLVCLKSLKGSFGHIHTDVVDEFMQKGIEDKDSAIKYLEAILLNNVLQDELSAKLTINKKIKV